MIFRPDGTLDLHIAERSFKPGDVVAGRVRLSLDEPVKARRLVVSLIGEEWVYITCGGGKNRTIYEKNIRLHDESIELSGEVIYRAVEKDFQFKLPANAPPTILLTPETIGSRIEHMEGTGLRWIVVAKLDIPMGLDINSEQEIFVS
jgi:hypothetical protein